MYTEEQAQEILAKLFGEPIPPKKMEVKASQSLSHPILNRDIIHDEDPMDRIFCPEKYAVLSGFKNDKERYEAVILPFLDCEKKIAILDDINDEFILTKLTEELSEDKLKLKALNKIKSKKYLAAVCLGFAPASIMIAALNKLDPNGFEDQSYIENITFKSGEMQAKVRAIELLDYSRWRLKIRRLADEVKNVASNTAQNEAAIKRLTLNDKDLLERISVKGESYETKGGKHHKAVMGMAKERLLELTGLF